MKKKRRKPIIASLLCVILLAGGTWMMGQEAFSREVPSENKGIGVGKNETSSSLQVHFLDVGQADCTLIVCEDEAMLIDAGNNADANYIKKYLKNQEITRLKYAVGTHPHEDHIGSMDAVIGTFAVETIFLPEVSFDSSYYTDVLHAVEERDVPITRPVPGDTYSLGGAEFTILAPNRDYETDMNNWSICLKLTYGSKSFLFTGDAEIEAEYDICENGMDLSADVYQVGHHGADTSTSQAWMKAVRPAYAVISVGEGNSYGHPAAEVLERLSGYGTKVFRTDEHGTIVAGCDGDTIIWSTGVNRLEVEETPEYKTTEELSVQADYILNERSQKFHRPDCGSVEKIADVNRTEFWGSRNEIIERGYSPCGNCKP